MKTYSTSLHSTPQIIELLRDIQCQEPAACAFLPEIAGMLDISQKQKAILTIEHPDDGENPVWGHLNTIISRKLAGLEAANPRLFQTEDSLDASHFSSLTNSFREIEKVPELPEALRAALLFEDFSKGHQIQSQWHNHPDIDFNVHNTASAQILSQTDILDRFEGVTPFQKALIIALVRYHGQIGQYVRGEITEHVFIPFYIFVRESAAELQKVHTSYAYKEAIHLILELYYLLNVIDTSGVREGLMTNSLLDSFASVKSMLQRMTEQTDAHKCPPHNLSRNECIAALSQRLSKLRNEKQKLGESEHACEEVLTRLRDEELSWICSHLARCQLWYAEAATKSLTILSMIKLLSLGIHEWLNSENYDETSIYHLDLAPIAAFLSPRFNAPTPQLSLSRSNYRRRLLEAILSEQSLKAIISGNAGIYRSDYMLAIAGMRGPQQSIELDVKESEEAEALITLLSIYERKSSVAYHSALKLLCDLYHLRKDEFDRLANEEQYLLTMNAAKSDKERMLKWLHSGRIVEIGPGGGVVLDLLEKRFPEAEIVGLDLSYQVIIALEQKKAVENAHWNVIQGNAFELPNLFDRDSLDGIIFCSILHEIYSYIETEDGTRFHLESVRDILRAAFKTLSSGGRILIRDGIMPPHEMRKLQFLSKDAKEFFEAFCREFKGRTISPNYIEPDVVLLDSADAMEFMYTYTWGPESFPYEVREQYGIMTYSDYCRSILEWLGPSARILQIPAEEACYLQEGYVTALKDQLKLMDIDGNEVRYPASNAVIVIEKI